MNARLMRELGSKLQRNIWKIATGLPKNIRNYKRFEDLELGGDLQASRILVSVRKIRRTGRTGREGSQSYLESSGKFESGIIAK